MRVTTILTGGILVVVAGCSSLSSGNSDTTINPTRDTITLYNTSARELKSNHIPDSVFEMTGLRELIVTGTDCDYGRIYDSAGKDITNCWGITEIPREIKQLTKLESLRLQVDAIPTIPPELAELSHLKTIDLSDNTALSDIDNLTKITSLEYLYLFGCGLNKLPANIGNLKNLKELGLTGNNIPAAEMARIRKVLPATCHILFQ